MCRAFCYDVGTLRKQVPHSIPISHHMKSRELAFAASIQCLELFTPNSAAPAQADAELVGSVHLCLVFTVLGSSRCRLTPAVETNKIPAGWNRGSCPTAVIARTLLASIDSASTSIFLVVTGRKAWTMRVHRHSNPVSMCQPCARHKHCHASHQTENYLLHFCTSSSPDQGPPWSSKKGY